MRPRTITVGGALYGPAMPSRLKCSYEPCDNRASGKHCSGHAAQLRTGKELTPLRKRGSGPDLCAYNDCPFESNQHGYCADHARQFKRGEELSRLEAGPPELCIFEGCDRQRYGKLELCSAHNQQKNKRQKLRPLYEHLIKADAVCKADVGCGHPVYANDYCRTHNEQQKNGRPFSVLPPPLSLDQVCTGPKCGREAVTPDRLCVSHGLLALRGEPIVPLKLRTSPEEIDDLIRRGVYWCISCQRELPLADFPMDNVRDRPRAKCKFCVGMELKAKNHQLTLVDIYRLFEYQDYKCAICSMTHQHESGLHLDHDHACCPNKGKSCGKCIRGLLCFNCNGGVLPSYERIRKNGPLFQPLEEYLDNPPALRLGLVSTAELRLF